MKLSTALVSITAFVTSALGATLEGQLQTQRVLTTRDVQHTYISISSVGSQQLEKSVYLKEDGSFKVKDLSEGTYIVSFNSIDYNLFPYKARVDVTVNDTLTTYLLTPGQGWEDSTATTLPHPITVFPNIKAPMKEYVKKRSPGLLESGPIATIVNNPLYLSLAVICITLALAPKILEWYDPSGVKEIRQGARNEMRDEKMGANASEATKKLSAVGEKVSGSSSPSPAPSAESKNESKKSKQKKKKN